MAEVEFIRKDIDGASFHRGVLVDVDAAKGGLVQVAAAEGADERRWIRKNAMRLARDTATPEGFAPSVGELVEVQVIEGEEQEEFYRLAEVRREQDGLYFVRYGGPRGTRHDSVDRRRIRPSFGLSPAVGDYAKREIRLPKTGKIPLDFTMICNKSGALALHEYPERPSVVALGEPRAVELAAMLVDLSVQKHRPSPPLLPSLPPLIKRPVHAHAPGNPPRGCTRQHTRIEWPGCASHALNC